MREKKLHELKMKLNQLSLKKTKKAADLQLDKLGTLEGKMKFKI